MLKLKLFFFFCAVKIDDVEHTKTPKFHYSLNSASLCQNYRLPIRLWCAHNYADFDQYYKSIAL